MGECRYCKLSDIDYLRYHVDIFKRFSVPVRLLDPDSVSYIVTSDEEVHYFFVERGDNTYASSNVRML